MQSGWDRCSYVQVLQDPHHTLFIILFFLDLHIFVKVLENPSQLVDLITSWFGAPARWCTGEQWQIEASQIGMCKSLNYLSSINSFERREHVCSTVVLPYSSSITEITVAVLRKNVNKDIRCEMKLEMRKRSKNRKAEPKIDMPTQILTKTSLCFRKLQTPPWGLFTESFHSLKYSSRNDHITHMHVTSSE